MSLEFEADTTAVTFTSLSVPRLLSVPNGHFSRRYKSKRRQ